MFRWRGTFRGLSIALVVAGTLAGCATKDGPRLPIPDQDVTLDVPAGKVRVVFFNTSNRLLYFESGPIRIQLDGRQVPSIWLDHYVQVFTEPGEHDLLLEHFDLITWKSRYTITLTEPEVFMEVYNHPTSTKYRMVETLPPDFATRFKPRDPNNW